MAFYNFNISNESISENPFFSDATKEELRLLLVLKELGGKAENSELCELCEISEPRLNSALMFWESAGILSVKNKEDIGFYGNEITDEFAERYIVGTLPEKSSLDVAKIIRNKGLSNLFDELASMAKKELTPMQIKTLAGYAEENGITEEYILTLAANIAEKQELTIHNLIFNIKKLTDKGILTSEDLNGYLSEEETSAKTISEYRKLFGIYGRKLTPTEKKMIDKWSAEYAFGIRIVQLAYDKSVSSIGKLSFAHIDAILSDWYGNGCKTIEDCEKRSEVKNIEFKTEYAEKKESVKAQRKPKKAEEPRFGNFDPEEAVRLALERSYSNISSDKEEG